MCSFGGKNPEDEKENTSLQKHKNKLQHLGSCDPPERNKSQPESSLKGKRSHVEFNPIPYGKPSSRAGHLYIALIPSPRAPRWKAKSPHRRHGVTESQLVALGTGQSCCVLWLGWAQKPCGWFSFYKTQPEGRKAIQCKASCRIPWVTAVPSRETHWMPLQWKITSWKKCLTCPFLKTQPQDWNPPVTLATVFSNHHLNVG